ncbi:transcription termination factor Rho, partial [Kineococcus sp. T13]|uniref:Rho termination factor N-terminal domain-containing protein n=1 Tax=Kineococcus vitellinus TaxID=2696565 RepID=UPI0030B82191|nr:transcription termination factor Rho [Kineococcus vitellinus]
MTDTTDIAATDGTATDGAVDAPARRTGSLSALRLPQLQALAAELGISGTGRMRKVDLLAAIREHQAAVPTRAARTQPAPEVQAAQVQAAQAPAPQVQAPQVPADAAAAPEAAAAQEAPAAPARR